MNAVDLADPAAISTEVSRRLLSFARPYWKEISLSMLLSLATTAANIGMMGTSAYLIATAALQPSIAVLQVAIVGVRTFGISRGVFRYLERLVSHSVNFKLLSELRGWFFRAIEPLVPGGVEDLKSGNLLAGSVQDIETLEDFYVRGIAPPIAAAIVTTGVSLFTLQYSISMAGMLAIGLILTGLVLSLQIRSITSRLSRARIQTRTRLSELAVETIDGAAEILMANTVDAHLQKIKTGSRQAKDASLSLSIWYSISLGTGTLISNLTLVGILYLGIPLVRSGQIDGVSLAVLALITLASFEPINLLPSATVKIETSLAAARRLFDLADRPVPIPEPIHPENITHFSNLTIRHLNFTYPGAQKPALFDVSLQITPGKRIAIVGPSGSGKTTLLNIIQHNLPVLSDTVFWNGKDACELDGYSIRGLIGVLSQNAYLFSTSIKENLKLANSYNPNFQSILEEVGLTAWLNSLPNRLDTWLGDNGSQLSGGERQRLLLARTILLNRPLLLADEPFANLDLASEDKLLHLLLQCQPNCAQIIATHRLTGMHLYDEILVLDDGKIVERGTHTDLLITQGLYRRLWEQQTNLIFFDR